MAQAIGGQAVLEGVMMRGPRNWAVAAAALLNRKLDAKNPVAVVSGGNVAPEIASGILASR